MKKYAISIIVLLSLLGLVVGLTWGLYIMLGAEMTALLAVLLMGGGYLIKSDIERRRKHEELLAAQKREQYFQFLTWLNEVFDSKWDDPTAPDKVSRLREWSLRLALIGSDDVVRTWNRASKSGDGGLDSLRVWGAFVLAMRRDCGHFKTGLTVSDALAPLINDIDNHRAWLDGDTDIVTTTEESTEPVPSEPAPKPEESADKAAA